MDGAEPAVEGGWGDFRKGGELLFGVAFHGVVFVALSYSYLILVLFISYSIGIRVL